MALRGDLLKSNALINKWGKRARELALIKVRILAPYVRNWRGDLINPNLILVDERHVKTLVIFTSRKIKVIVESDVYAFWRVLYFSYKDLTNDDAVLIQQWTKEAEDADKALLERIHKYENL